ncbi:hypothetical protein BG015_003261 [Linnemannia schmuckeri]|uniref:Uncharacterized protein n=1 Tax=Linnemannia schmuckeri TaxID=64567 RepID=A0A9P5RLX1_9FUNG|nr:hypothetical protein BG015_003261 [Linnemannia schmuckeri]
MASPRSPSLDRGALSHVLGMESLATTASAAAAAASVAALSSAAPTTADNDHNNTITVEHYNSNHIEHNSNNNNIAKSIEDRSKNWTTDTNTDTDMEMDKDSDRHRHRCNNSNNGVHHHAVATGNNRVVPHSTKTAMSSLSPSPSFSSAIDTSSQQDGVLHKDLLVVDSAHYKDFATAESGRKRKNLSDSTTAVVSESTLQSHTALSSSLNVAIVSSSTSSSSSMPSSIVEVVVKADPIVEQDRHLKRIKANHVGDQISTTPHAPADSTAHTSSTRNGRERKRRLSDDLVTPIMSGTSTPGRHSASPSRSVVSVSTPSSSVPAASVSPVVAQGSEEYDHHLKRPRVYNVDEDSDNDSPVTDARRQNGPIVIDDDGDADGDVDSDGNSNQADYNTSFTYDTSVSGQDDSNLPRSLYVEDDSENRELSPARSAESDATITPRRLRAVANGSTVQVRASSIERQAEPATSPRQNLSRSTSTEPQSNASQAAPTVHSIDDDPDNEEVIEIIDLTPQPRIGSYPRGDSLPRVPGLTPQHSFQLPTLQRLVSRSSQSVERSQTRPTNRSSNNSIDILEIPDDNDDDDDFYGRDTVRIDSEVREVQLDPHHPWSRGPIQLILPAENRLELEGHQRPQIEDVVDVDDHLPAIDYAEIESDSEEEDVQGSQEAEEDGLNERQVDEEVSYILSLRRDSTSGRVVSRRTTPQPPPRTVRQGSFPARSPPSFNMRSPSYEAQPITFPTTSRRSTTPLTRGQHRYNPVVCHPSPVRLILRDPAPPSSYSSSSARPSSRRAPSFSPDSLDPRQQSRLDPKPEPESEPLDRSDKGSNNDGDINDSTTTTIGLNGIERWWELDVTASQV